MDKPRSLEPSEIFALSRRELHDPALQAVHGPIFPEDIRPVDRVLARLRVRGAAEELKAARVWRLSPLGVELIVDPTQSYDNTTPIDLELVIAGQRSTFEGLVVDTVAQMSGQRILGIRLVRRTASNLPGHNRRSGDRWLCADDFLPTCIAPTPGRIDDFVYFKIRDFSAAGLQLSCSLRNKFLAPGMHLNLTAVFPMAQTAQFGIEIQRVSIGSFEGKDRLTVGASFRKLTPVAKAIIGQYLIQFSNVETLDDLRKADFSPGRVSPGIDFYNVRSESDYLSVLRLRYMAHEKDGNLNEGVSPNQLADLYDAESRLIVGKYRGVVVATARVRFPSTGEKQEAAEGYLWTKALPRKDQVVEVSRVATHPSFRRNDLLAALFRYCYLATVQNDRPWVVMSCLDHMVSFYSRLGFSPTGIRYTEPHWRADRILNLMIANVNDIVLGKGVSPLYWNSVWRSLADHYIANNLISVTGIDRARLVLLKMIGSTGISALSYMLRSLQMRIRSTYTE